MSQKIEVHTHDWLSLVSRTGLLLSEPVLFEKLPDGPVKVSQDLRRSLKDRWERFEIRNETDPTAQARWLEFILEKLLGYDYGYWLKHPNIPDECKCELTEFNQKIIPDRVLYNQSSKEPLVLFIGIPATNKIDAPETETGKWKASPFTKLDKLLRTVKVPFGIVSNGNEFRLVYAATGLPTSYIEWSAKTFIEEPTTLDAFYSILNKNRFFNEKESELLKTWVDESQKRQIDVTDQLGEQVLEALDEFVNAIDLSDRESNGELLKDLTEDQVYETALVTTIRLVFLLYAEENYLLPHGVLIYDRGYGITNLYIDLQKTNQSSPGRLKNNYNAWGRLLATFRLIHNGCFHPDIALLAYGGKLFDPKRYPVLEDKNFKISNEKIFLIIRKLAFTEPKKGKHRMPQRVSYRTLDIEQIGSIYESLMEYKVKRASEPMVIFKGKARNIRPVNEFKNFKGEELEQYLSNVTGINVKKIKENFKKKKLDIESFSEKEEERIIAKFEIDKSEIFDALEEEEEITEFIGDIDEYFQEIIATNWLYITPESMTRKSSGSFYTPKQLTSFLVEQALEPLCFEGEDENKSVKSPQELLSLTVCDPAMGSGAFLVQACRYLAERLVESWELERDKHPDEKLTLPYCTSTKSELGEIYFDEEREKLIVRAKRFVAENCLYGVDLNPMAVDLAKISLWLATLSKDRPFTFLDHRLRCGNSLIGTEFSRLSSIPSEPLWSKDKKKNRQILKKVTPITDFQTSRMIEKIIRERKELSKHELNIIDIEEKEKLMKSIEAEGSEYSKIKQLCDLWCSVWFWPYKEKKDINKKENYSLVDFSVDLEKNKNINQELKTELEPPHTDRYRQIVKYFAIDEADIPKELCEKYLKIAGEVVKEQRFFHWELEFPEIFLNENGIKKENPGFDVVIGNPPWDMVKENSDEFFSVYDPNFRRLKSADKKQQMKKLIEINNEMNILWKKYKKQFADWIIFYSNNYINQGKGHINSFKLFMEISYNLCKKKGNYSVVVPSGLYTDDGCTELRKLFLNKGKIINLICYENRKKIFPIDSRFKFVLFTIQKGVSVEKFRAGFMLHDLGALSDIENNSLILNKEIIEKFSPNTLSIMEFKNQIDIDITKTIYDNWSLLGDNIEGKWNTYFRREINQTDDSEILEISPNYYVVYEGKMISPFYHQFDNPKYWLNKQNAEKFYGFEKTSQLYQYRCGYRAVASSTNEISLISTIIPRNSGTVESLRVLQICENDNEKKIKKIMLNEQLFISAILNSFVLNYIIRQKVSANISAFYVYQLPVPKITNGNWFFNQILPRVTRLICVTRDFTELWNKNFLENWLDLNINNGGTSILENWRKITPNWIEECGVYGWTEDKRDLGDRAQLRAEIDALVAHLYGLTEDEFSYILDTFPVLKKNEEAAFDEFRSKRMCLEEYRRFKPIIEEEKKKYPEALDMRKYVKEN